MRNYLTLALLLASLTGARAESYGDASFCADISHVEALKQADLQGKGDEVFDQLVAAKHCVSMKVRLEPIFIVEQYIVGEDSPEYRWIVLVHVWLNRKWESAYAIFVSYPLEERKLIRVVDNGQWETTDPKVREWYQELKQPDNPRMSCCGQADAYYADTVYTKDGKNYAVITDTREDAPLQRPHVPFGTEIEIPNHKYKWDRGNPTGHSVIFLTLPNNEGQREVYCFVDGNGV